MNSTLTAIRSVSPCSRETSMMRRAPRMTVWKTLWTAAWMAAWMAAIAALFTGCASKPNPATELTTLQPAITSGTGSNATPAAGESLVENVDLIAVDLVNALSQIAGLHPSETVLQMEPPATRFGIALKTVLEQAGYGLRVVHDSDTSQLLSHAVTKLETESNGVHNSYQVIVGEIRLKREYFEQPFGVTPSSNMFVMGADATQITLNDDLFTLASTQTIDVSEPEIQPQTEPQTEPVIIAEPVELLAAIAPETLTSAKVIVAADEAASVAQPVLATTPVSVVPSQSDEVSVQVFPTQQASAKIEEPEPLIRKNRGVSQVKIKGNMYQLGESNFTQLLANYADMKKDILVFRNDSMRLGRKNKETLDSFVTDFVEDSDVISVIGCSHGRTALTNGNAVLATGRAQRVKEALMFAGIPEDRILEEGCWAAEYFDEVMPRRGVVITHKRERRNS